MEKLNKKHQDLIAALETLSASVSRFACMVNTVDANNFDDYELLLMVRDSVIQRFEYCFELTWKYLVIYMESKEEIEIPVISPKTVFRTACQAKLISEQDAAQALQMVEDRNKTSHIYREEIADYIAKSAAGYHQLMVSFAQKFLP